MLERRFRYETLLRIRQRREDIKALALAEARRDQHRAEAERTDIEAARMRALEGAKRLLEGDIPASDVRRYYQYERHLSRLAVEKDAEIVELTSVSEAKRRELDAAMKEKKVVEKLKERHIEAYRAEVFAAEGKAADEIANIRSALHGTVEPEPYRARPGADT